MRKSVVIGQWSLVAFVLFAVAGAFAGSTNRPPVAPIVPVTASVDALAPAPTVAVQSNTVVRATVPTLNVAAVADPMLLPITPHSESVLDRIHKAAVLAQVSGDTNEFQRLQAQYWRLWNVAAIRATNTALRAQ